MGKYELIIENPINAYILDKDENIIVALCSTKIPHLEFDKLKNLIEKANGNILKNKEIENIKKGLNDNKECLTVKDLKEFIEDKPDIMKVYITSNDEMPVRKLTDISSEEKTGYYSELYLDTVEC